MNKIFLNKKGQVGITITWMVAFVVIFFIMLLFVAMSIYLVGKKQFNKNEIRALVDFDILTYQKELVKFLTSPVEFEGKKENFKELIIKWYSLKKDTGEVQTKIDDYFSKTGLQCYALSVRSDNKERVYDFLNSYKFSGKTSVGGSALVGEMNLESPKSVNLILPIDGDKLNIGFYGKYEC